MIDEIYVGPDFEERLIRGDRVLRPCVYNAVLLIANHPQIAGRLRLNTLADRKEFRGQDGEWRRFRDTDVTDIQCIMDPVLVFSTSTMFEAVNTYVQSRRFHPVRDYLSKLKWDGTARLNNLFSKYFVSDDSELTRQAGAKFMISAVARAFEPGCKVDTYPVLEGDQGLQKSTAILTLVGNKEWFLDSEFSVESKEGYLTIQGKWIIEVAELHAFSKTEATKLKSFVSSRVDTFRPPYGREVKDHPRQVVFIATTNDSDYVNDWTGERRKWPIPVESIDIDAIARDRDQLWAEARVRYEAGEHWYFDKEAEAEMTTRAMDRFVEDPWIEKLREELYKHLRKSVECPRRVTSQDLYKMLSLDPERMSQADSRRIGRCIRGLGLTSAVIRANGTAKRGWAVPQEMWVSVNSQKKKEAVQ